MTTFVLLIAIGTVLSVLVVMYGFVRPRNSKSLVELEMEIYRDWESTIGDGSYEPKDAFGRPYPIEHTLACVGDGWAGLVRECYQLCVEYEVDVHQVKEKFGGLRFYTGGVHRDKGREFYDAIESRCERSYSICENCGEPGELDTNRSWYKTTCPNCTGVSRLDAGFELAHLLSPDALDDWNARVESGEVRRVLTDFIGNLKKAIESKDEEEIT